MDTSEVLSIYNKIRNISEMDLSYLSNQYTAEYLQDKLKVIGEFPREFYISNSVLNAVVSKAMHNLETALENPRHMKKVS